MLRVSLRNLLVHDVFKVVPLEFAMSSNFWLISLLWVVFLECITSSNIPLRCKVQWRDKLKPCYKYVCMTSSQLVGVKTRVKNKN